MNFTFRVGDKVMVINEAGHCFKIGDIGEVKSTPRDFITVRVGKYTQYLYSHQLKLVEEVDYGLYI